MNKLKAFFLGLILLVIVLTSVFFVVLNYNASNQAKVKTYIFQMDNSANKRVGDIQNIADMKDETLLYKLIQKYIAEYFKVIPGSEIRPEQKNAILEMSHPDVFKKWSNGEAQNIAEMANKKMFRNVWVNPALIQKINNQNWFAVPYTTRTWTESNNMAANVVYETGKVVMHVIFRKGIKPNINIRKHLEQGKNPATLFIFWVTEIQ